MIEPEQHWDGGALHQQIFVDGRTVDVIISRQALIEHFDCISDSPADMRTASVKYAERIHDAVARKVRQGDAEPIRIDSRDF